MNNPERRPGIAKTMRSIFPKTGYPSILSQKPPPRIRASANKMKIHIPILNEDTDPSIIPQKKKTKVIMQINASMAHNIRNNFNFMNMSSIIHKNPFVDRYCAMATVNTHPG